MVLQVRRWQRYGHDRLYVSTEDGRRVGYHDLRKSLTVIKDDSRESEIRAALAPLLPLSRGPDDLSQGEAVAMRAQEPAALVEAKAASEYRDAVARHPVVSRIQRVFGVDAGASWRAGADGERAVARVLGKLPEGWVVFHSVKVGSRGSDIDHVVIGPPGVFTVNTKNHQGCTVWAGGDSVMVNGRRTRYVPIARYEAQRAQRLLSEAVGWQVPVTGVLAILCRDGIRTGDQLPQDVLICSRHLRRLLTGQPPRLTSDALSQVIRAAEQSETWIER